MDDMILKVEPGVLLKASGEMKTEQGNMGRILEEAKSLVTGLSKDWESEASLVYGNKFTAVHDDIQNVLNIVMEYATDLEEIAQVYTTAENTAKTAAEGLPTDVFKA